MSTPLPNKYSVLLRLPLYWPSRLGSSFPHIPKASTWNCGIFKNSHSHQHQYYLFCLVPLNFIFPIGLKLSRTITSRSFWFVISPWFSFSSVASRIFLKANQHWVALKTAVKSETIDTTVRTLIQQFVRRDFPCILYLSRISYLAFKCSVLSCSNRNLHWIFIDMLTFSKKITSFWIIIQLSHGTTTRTFLLFKYQPFVVFNFEILRNSEQGKLNFLHSFLWKFSNSLAWLTINFESFSLAYKF